MEVNIDRVKDRFTDSTRPLPRGLGAYDATLSYNPQGISILNVTGISPFDTTFANIDQASGQVLLAGFHSQSQGPQSGPVAHSVVRLMGNAVTSYALSLNFSTIADVMGEYIAQEAPATRTYLRGDAKADGVVDIVDALFIAQYVVQLRPLSDLNAVNAASVRYDGDAGDKIDIVDALFVAQMTVALRNVNFE